MNDNTTYYKAVSAVNSTLVSAIVYDKWLTVEYKLNEWTHASDEMQGFGYHLFVFDSLQSCRKFLTVSITYNPRIYKCKVRDIVPLPEYIPTYRLKLRDYLIGYLDGTYVDRLSRAWPDGTVMAKGVKLVEFVERFT